MGDKGLDGKGLSTPKETSAKESVDVTVKTDVPGKGSIKTEGPNPGGSSSKKY